MNSLLQRMLKDIEVEVRLTKNSTGINALNKRVLSAIKQVPRSEFVPGKLRGRSYDNVSLPIESGQTISQPFIVALMSELLNTRPTDNILEIGTGSGYQAAVLSNLVEQVYSIEIIESLALSAKNRLTKLGYRNINLRTGDGYFGWPERAPFDGIIVTAAVLYIPTPWIEQLKTGARLIIPVGLSCSYQELMVVEKKTGGELETQTILGVSFVPLTGEHLLDFPVKLPS